MQNKEKQHIRANPDCLEPRCPNCGKSFLKNNALQIAYFCSKKCRKSYREVPTIFERIKQ